MSWEANKDFIVSQVESGGGTQSMISWYTRWVSSGSPDTKDGMKSQATLDAEKAQAEAAEAAAQAAAQQAAAQAAAQQAAQEAAAQQAAAQAAADAAAAAAALAEEEDGFTFGGGSDTNATAAAEAAAAQAAAEAAAAEAQAQAEAAAAQAQAQAEAAAAAAQAQAEADAQAAAQAQAAAEAAAQAEAEVEVEAEVAFEPEEPQLSQWEQNKNFIIQQVEAGTADQGMQEWYDRWQYSGSPETKDSMLTITQYENKKRYDEYQAQQQAEHEAAQAAQAELDLDRPDGVSRYLWDKVKKGSLDYNLTSIINKPDVRDAIIEAGYGDYVKAVHEQAMDQRAAHYQSNGASAQNAWNNAQYDWYTDNYGSYVNDTATESSVTDLGFGGGTTVINEDYVNTAIQDALAAAQEQAEAAQAAADAAAAEAAAAAAADQAAADEAAAQAQAEADAAAAAAAEAAAAAQAEADAQAAAEAEAAAQAQAAADAAAAEQAAIEREEYLQGVNQGMQVGIHGNNPGGNPWGTPNAGGQGMFGQAYGQAKANPNVDRRSTDWKPVSDVFPTQGKPQTGGPRPSGPGVVQTGGNTPQPNYQPAPRPSGPGVVQTGGNTPQPVDRTGGARPSAPRSTPFADAYIKAKKAAEQPNAVTSMFSKDLFN